MNTITTFIPSDIISLNHGQPMTTSLKVAEVFGKRHDNVLRKLEALECSPEFTALNFEVSEYTDTTGRKLSMWNMTKDGFIFLVMGFTGKQAAAIKEAYINAFNWMANKLLTTSLKCHEDVDAIISYSGLLQQQLQGYQAQEQQIERRLETIGAELAALHQQLQEKQKARRTCEDIIQHMRFHQRFIQSANRKNN